jgi:hypothetical protein
MQTSRKDLDPNGQTNQTIVSRLALRLHADNAASALRNNPKVADAVAKLMEARPGITRTMIAE